MLSPFSACAVSLHLFRTLVVDQRMGQSVNIFDTAGSDDSLYWRTWLLRYAQLEHNYHQLMHGVLGASCLDAGSTMATFVQCSIGETVALTD